MVITDLGVLRPDPVTHELTLVSVHPGVSCRAGRGRHRLGSRGEGASRSQRAADGGGARHASRPEGTHQRGACPNRGLGGSLLRQEPR